MQQRQLRLGDILDDYCPRERRLTNHAIVAMVEADVKRTRCTTCDAEHEYKHAKVPHQRRKSETPAALYAQVLGNAPKKIAHEPNESESQSDQLEATDAAGVVAEAADTSAEGLVDREARAVQHPPAPAAAPEPVADESSGETLETGENAQGPEVDGPVHRRLIRATLPRTDGQPPPQRPIPEFTIRQPGGRQNRFRARHGRGGGGQSFQNGRQNGAGGGPPRGGRPQGPGRQRQGHGRKRSK